LGKIEKEKEEGTLIQGVEREFKISAVYG